ncbi:unnamed protein product [Brassicogethes aeneus]|uniref:Uncharacterized protein n=1 Tax=Brassicogethes aeneus TaxID=1431903 RepID=A0A9P0FJS3_BRAAE|nr:unnamed protein product [Brassicogethes aeneus]
MDEKEFLKIHGIRLNESGTDSDTGKSDFDDEYNKYRPKPIRLDPSKIVVISANTQKIKEVNLSDRKHVDGCGKLLEGDPCISAESANNAKYKKIIQSLKRQAAEKENKIIFKEANINSTEHETKKSNSKSKNKRKIPNKKLTNDNITQRSCSSSKNKSKKPRPRKDTMTNATEKPYPSYTIYNSNFKSPKNSLKANSIGKNHSSTENITHKPCPSSENVQIIPQNPPLELNNEEILFQKIIRTLDEMKGTKHLDIAKNKQSPIEPIVKPPVNPPTTAKTVIETPPSLKTERPMISSNVPPLEPIFKPLVNPPSIPNRVKRVTPSSLKTEKPMGSSNVLSIEPRTEPPVHPSNIPKRSSIKTVSPSVPSETPRTLLSNPRRVIVDEPIFTDQGVWTTSSDILVVNPNPNDEEKDNQGCLSSILKFITCNFYKF